MQPNSLSRLQRGTVVLLSLVWIFTHLDAQFLSIVLICAHLWSSLGALFESNRWALRSLVVSAAPLLFWVPLATLAASKYQLKINLMLLHGLQHWLFSLLLVVISGWALTSSTKLERYPQETIR